ncbi:MAG: DUF3300 domain-containing protein [Syntrophorhabdus sp.]|nr:DUF3300 domain-containing protein [Syntrophorhabdus sp.]
MMNRVFALTLIWVLVVSLVIPAGVFAQGTGTSKPVFKQEELEQILAPIALYPDELIAQILMASTYPLEVVEAARWVKANPSLKGNQLTSALEKQNWDPSVKSLVNFPSVLNMMNDKLDWTQKLGDAFLAQQKDVMSTVQRLRAKAQASGNLKTTKEQKVVVQDQVIVIQPADPQVIYVPTYNPTVVYGAWPYPAYPPYYYYPPGYVAGVGAFSFAAGVAVGAAWGYAWGGCNWHHGDVNVNVNKNVNVNNQINRNYYANKISTNPGGQGEWKHDPTHRKGVAYRDQATGSKYGQGPRPGADARKEFRGYSPDARGSQPQAAGRSGRDSMGQGRSSSVGSRSGTPRFEQDSTGRQGSGHAFEGMERGGTEAKMESERGRASRESMTGSRSGSERGSGGFGRSGGGGRRR